MESDTIKIIALVILIIIILFFIEYTDNKNKKNVNKIDNSDSEVLVKDRYVENANINDVLFFDYANLNYQGFVYNEFNNSIIINYLEICEKIGDKYLFTAKTQNGKKLNLNVETEETNYNQGEDLYYTNYHLKIELDVSVKIIELKISRDNAEYIVKCSVEMFTK